MALALLLPLSAASVVRGCGWREEEEEEDARAVSSKIKNEHYRGVHCDHLGEVHPKRGQNSKNL
jgi:hypothetical protein